MPVFAYRGINRAGRAVRGTLDAEHAKTLRLQLRRDGIFVTELNATGRTAAATGARRPLGLARLGGGVKAGDLAVATRQLSTLIGAGIPLVEALVALIDQVDNPRLKSVWAEVKQRVNEGAGFGDALGGHPKIFTGLYTNMVRAGETSGALDVVLSRLADFTEGQAELRQKIGGTMVYPALMSLLAVAVVGLLMVVVVPQISVMFVAQKAALPLPTRILIATSNFSRDRWWLMLLVGAAAAAGARRYVRTPPGRRRWDRFVLDAPLFGPLVRMVAVTRFCRTLSTLLASGVPLLSAFDIVKNVVENTRLLEVIEKARDCVKEGESIAAPLKRSGQFPPIVTHMIAIGERSGTLEQMLGNVARSYEVQVDARVRAMTSILEPALMVFMGGVVGFIVFAIMMPMMQISSFAG